MFGATAEEKSVGFCYPYAPIAGFAYKVLDAEEPHNGATENQDHVNNTTAATLLSEGLKTAGRVGTVQPPCHIAYCH